MVFETKPVRITELAKETEQYLLQKGCKKSTLGVYKATWHKFMAFSSSDVYSRTAAEDFLKLYFGVDVHSAIQKLDSRMRPCFKAHECFGRLSKYRCCSAKKDARTLFNCARTV